MIFYVSRFRVNVQWMSVEYFGDGFLSKFVVQHNFGLIERIKKCVLIFACIKL